MGAISPQLQNYATRVINSQEFQRVKDRLVDDLETQEKQHIEQKTFTNNIQSLAVEARVNRNDLDHIIRNLQQPPAPPPQPPAPNLDAAADRVRLMAELEGMGQARQRAEAAAALAQRNLQELMAQRTASPAERIIERHVIPAPAQPVIVQPNFSQHHVHMRHYGLTMQQLILMGFGGPPPPPAPDGDEIPIEYTNPPPPPPPGAGGQRIKAGYGKVAIPKRRPGPFVRPPGNPPGPPPPGPTAALTDVVRPQPKKMPRKKGKNDDPPPPPDKPVKRRTETAGPQPPGRQRDLPAFTNREDAITNATRNTLRASAKEKMQMIGHQKAQNRRRGEMGNRMRDLERARRRGGERGDVVPLGKRKASEANLEARPAFQPRQRTGARREGPQLFSLTA